MAEDTGWKPLPVSLKILAVVLIFWSAMSLFTLMSASKSGIPLFGAMTYGTTAIIIVVLLDFAGPIAFLYSLYNRKSWGWKIAMVYMGFFVLNMAFAGMQLSSELGAGPIIAPAVATIIFMIVIYRNRSYFSK